MKKPRIIFLALLLVSQVNVFHAQETQADAVPHRIILNLTQTPQNSVAVSWRTNNEFKKSKVEYSEATKWIEYVKAARTVEADGEKYQVDNSRAKYHYSAILSGLKPDTYYIYRVGHDSVWSEWNQFKTAADGNTPFKFIYFGDPQNNILSQVSRVFRQAFKTAGDADFWLFAGDLITNPLKDELWNEWFSATGFIHAVTPSIMIPGNHEYPTIKTDSTSVKELIPLWRLHFTLPENGIKGMEESSYFIDYQGVRFIMLNGNKHLEEQAEWMESILKSNPNKWTIVTMHQPVYSTAEDRDNQVHRKIFQPLFDKYLVDLVLQGHDHTYARSLKLKNGEAVGWSQPGTVYIGSISGPKAYPLNTRYKHIMAKQSTEIQLFQVISVEQGSISYNAYTADGKIYDSFEVKK